MEVLEREKVKTVLWNLRLTFRDWSIGHEKAKKYFKGNMSAFVRQAIRQWKPKEPS
jgi:hypothetical protein